MRFFTSVIVADARNVELGLYATPEARRFGLIDWFNDHVGAGGLGPETQLLSSDTPIEWVILVIEDNTGRAVTLGEITI